MTLTELVEFIANETNCQSKRIPVITEQEFHAIGRDPFRLVDLFRKKCMDRRLMTANEALHDSVRRGWHPPLEYEE